MPRYQHQDWYTKCYRFIYRLTHGKKWRHMSHTLPHLKLVVQGDHWQIYWRGKHINTSQSWQHFRNLSPELIYCIGSGPSIKEQDLSKIGQTPSILVNGAVSLAINAEVTNPIALVIEDARFVAERIELIRQAPDELPIVISTAALQTLGAQTPELLATRKFYIMQGFRSRYGQKSMDMAELPKQDYRINKQGARFSLDLAQGHFGCGTVLYSAIQLAVYCQSKHIRMAGLDLTNLADPRFYENKQDQAWTGLDKAYEHRILPALCLARNVCDEHGISLENCSHTSIVPREVMAFSDALMPKL